VFDSVRAIVVGTGSLAGQNDLWYVLASNHISCPLQLLVYYATRRSVYKKT